MKRLFQVNDPHGNPAKQEHGVVYFGDKMAAKSFRDGSNATHGQGYTVSPGPDHRGLLTRKSRGHVRANRTHTA